MSNTTSLARLACATLALAALLGGCAGQRGMQGGTTQSAPGMAAPAARGTLSMDDRTVAMQAAGSGLYEVAAGRLAAARATDAGLRSYAEMLVQHHSASNAELASLLAARGLAPPAMLPPQFDARLAAMSALPADRFDARFVQLAGVLDHRSQVALFEHASRTVQDPALRDWFARTLPVLRQHLQGARQLAGTLGG